jgi:hypothetical protein
MTSMCGKEEEIPMICHTIPRNWLDVIRGQETTHPEIEAIRAFESSVLVGRKLSHSDSTYSYAGVVQTFWLIDPLPALKAMRQEFHGEMAVDIIERINNDNEWFEEEVIRPFLVDVKVKHPDIWTYAIMLSGVGDMNNHVIWMDPSDEKNLPHVAYWVYYAILECLEKGYYIDEI